MVNGNDGGRDMGCIKGSKDQTVSAPIHTATTKGVMMSYFRDPASAEAYANTFAHRAVRPVQETTPGKLWRVDLRPAS